MRDLIRERYYDHRAPVYDITSCRGDPVVDAALDRETAEIGSLLGELQGAKVLEVGCGTGVFTQFLRGTVVAIDQSEPMLRLARNRVPSAIFVKVRLPGLPFLDDSFDTVVAANFYGLLHPSERLSFLDEARRVARELIAIDLRCDRDQATQRRERRVIDGQVYQIFRRRFTPEGLCAELGGELLYPGRYFLAVRAAWR